MSILIFNHSDSILDPLETRIMVDAIGYIGGALTAAIMLPQVYKAYKTKETRHISGKFLIIQISATILNIIYGFLENLLPIIVTLPIIGILTILLMVAKCLYDGN